MTTTGTQTHDLGNTDSVMTGCKQIDDGYGQQWVALTRVDSKTFKTERGAVAWLARRGYNADGTRQR